MQGFTLTIITSRCLRNGYFYVKIQNIFQKGDPN